MNQINLALTLTKSSLGSGIRLISLGLSLYGYFYLLKSSASYALALATAPKLEPFVELAEPIRLLLYTPWAMEVILNALKAKKKAHSSSFISYLALVSLRY